MEKNRKVKEIEKAVKSHFEISLAERIFKNADKKFEALCKENKGETAAVRAHTVKVIYPVVSFYKAMQKEGVDKEEAYKVISEGIYADAEMDADSMRSLLKLPGLYRLMPYLWKKVTVKSFGLDAGFMWSFYPTDGKRVKFDMTKCPYCENFKKYGCFELTKILCRTDDIKNGDIHPHLLWNRTKTMGDGDDLCDFDLIVK